MNIDARGCWLAVLFALGCAATPTKSSGAPAAGAVAGDAGLGGEVGTAPRAFIKPSDAELRQRLTPMQYEVTQHEHTEPPYRNDYWDLHDPGLFVDIVSGEPLFTSVDKYDSRTGWPSFTRPISDAKVVERSDHKLAYERTELRSPLGDSHLGHLFKDGPPPAGLRYCINSAALRFIPLAELEKEGYGAYRPLFAAGARVVVPR